MRRATAIVLALFGLLAQAIDPVHAEPQQINGVGLVDYTRPPDFKVGDWLKYRMSGQSELGVDQSYTLTLLVAGELDFWGDRCFWLEAWQDLPGQPTEIITSAISYEAFKDPLAPQRLQFYTRAVVTTDSEGDPFIQIMSPGVNAFSLRREISHAGQVTRDTLGIDTCSTPLGEYRTLKIVHKEGVGITQSVGDSTTYFENREERTTYHSDKVMLTHLVREDVMGLSTQKSWLIGRSSQATPVAIRDRALGTARLIDMGRGGLEARAVPEKYRFTVAEQHAAKVVPR